MTMTERDQYSGVPPMPVVELTLEQDFKLRQLEDQLPHASKDDIITIFLALQHQNYVLGNNIKQLLQHYA